MKKYKIIIFDWDGTLASSMAQIAEAVRYAFGKIGRKGPSDKQIRDIIGLRLDMAFEVLAPNATEQEIDILVKSYRDLYLRESNKAKLYEGVKDGLALLKDNFVLAVATGKGRVGLDKVIGETGLDGFFVTTRTVDECEGKPSPEMVESILEQTGYEPSEAIVVGDTSHDLGMAKNANCDRVAMLYGAHDKNTLAQYEPLACFDDFKELVDWFMN